MTNVKGRNSIELYEFKETERQAVQAPALRERLHPSILLSPNGKSTNILQANCERGELTCWRKEVENIFL